MFYVIVDYILTAILVVDSGGQLSNGMFEGDG